VPRLAKPFQPAFFPGAPAVVTTHLGTDPTARKRKALQKPTQPVHSHLLINIYLQEKLIKRCLTSIFHQFCFVTGLCAVPQGGAAFAGLPGSRGNPRPAPPRLASAGGFFSTRCFCPRP